MPVRTLVELFYTVAGVLATMLVVWLAAWAYPLGAATIWRIGYVAMAAAAGTSIPALKLAWAKDRGPRAHG